MRRGIIWAVVGAFVASAGAPLTVSAGEEPSKQESAGVPHTAQEHLARAAAYKEKAAQYRKEADEHRKMLAGYKKAQGSPALENKMGREEPWVGKMRQHCESYIKAAETMAAEADSFAQFHRMRGEEMQGK